MKRTIHPTMFRNHPLTFISSLILIPVLVGIVVLIVWYLSVKNEKMVIKDDQIFYEKGILNKKRSQINIDDIRNIKTNESITDRMFGVGSIGISTAGQGNIEISMSGIKDVVELRDYINNKRKELSS